ncbi:type I-E CRISPR-associated protein Cse2/CasB (plasmid) [Streptomyces sp. NBC_01591]|uniref:type I-E CRISPR-associated protein Cse2/CasB n=1 Tax=Streptomyces sp. NBC_01591 TaxID=2975888 RepID=UPI002DDA28EE|nr:type I-E CRISPR-associated protein Cse2/CasB [Streptomyces sp. NBC_01591]WSD74804.1 type I-E CRISPR-associated protein Cse2/CasB [Streptomyces sp. NBC_01591]
MIADKPGTGSAVADGAEPREPARSQQLAQWLVGLVNSRDYGRLAELRRPSVSERAHIEAGWIDEERREVFEQVAFLFAVYHRGAAEPSWGYGSLGYAARRIGSSIGRGPDDAGAGRLMDRIVASRRPPQRHLQHAIARLRSCGEPPPSWARLADDIARWSDRQARIRYRWAVDFHAPPPKAARNTRTTTTTTKDTLT